MRDYPIAGEDYKLNLPKGYLSHSQIDLFLQCPEKYWFQYISDVEPEKDYGSALFEGTCWDAIMGLTGESYIKKGKHITKDTALKAYKKMFSEGEKDVTSWLEDRDTCLERGIHFVREFWDKNLTKTSTPLVMQKEFLFEIAGVPIKGFIDQIEEDVLIDHKYAKDSRYYKPEKSQQLMIYSLVENQPNVAFQLCEKKSRKIRWLEAKLDMDYVKWLLPRRISAVAMAISNRVFYPNVDHKFCDERWCKFHDECVGTI